MSETESLLIGNSTYDLYNLFTQKDGKHFESLSISNQYKKLTKLIDDYLGIKENINQFFFISKFQPFFFFILSTRLIKK